MDEHWPKQVEQLVALLRSMLFYVAIVIAEVSLTTSCVCAESTRDSTADLLSVSYSTISCEDAMHALGFSQPQDLLQCKHSALASIAHEPRIIAAHV